MTIVVPLLLVKHYANTGEAQNAPVVTNGPQMELPGNLQFTTLATLTIIFYVTPALIGGALGYFAGGAAAIPIPYVGTSLGIFLGALTGALAGANLHALMLFLLGLAAKPFGSVFARAFAEPRNPAVTSTYHIGRTTTGYPAYRVGPLNPTGLNPGNVPPPVEIGSAGIAC